MLLSLIQPSPLPPAGKYTITKEFSFCAAHHLTDYDGPCHFNHGHNYVVVLELCAEVLQGPGFVREFKELNVFKDYLDSQLDHKSLNDTLPGDYGINPTTEKLAEFLYCIALSLYPEISAIHVSETPKTWVSYRPLPT